MSAINPNLNLPRRGALALLLAAGCAADVHAAPRPNGPPAPPPTPSAEELATIPSLSAEQQVQLHRILIERRDAHEAVARRTRDTLDAQREKDRAEHERIDDQSADRMRKLLGEDGFRLYADWQQSHRGRGEDRGGPEEDERLHERQDRAPRDHASPDDRRPRPHAADMPVPPAPVDERR
ncbi:MAG: hypothetical protein ABIW82_13545 [Dokdonella sp.]